MHQYVKLAEECIACYRTALDFYEGSPSQIKLIAKAEVLEQQLKQLKQELIQSEAD